MYSVAHTVLVRSRNRAEVGNRIVADLRANRGEQSSRAVADEKAKDLV